MDIRLHGAQERGGQLVQMFLRKLHKRNHFDLNINLGIFAIFVQPVKEI
jgi:hypothetical protein